VWHSFNPSNTTVPGLASQCASQVPCLNATFSDSNSAVGIGDVVLRGKYTVYKGERLANRAGVDVRLPSGDATNFLGSGATGVEPFGVISYSCACYAPCLGGLRGKRRFRSRRFEHRARGYKPRRQGSLPNRLLYTVGADVRVTGRLTAAFDLYGQRLFGSPELVSQTYTDYGNCSGPTNADGVNCTVYTPGTTHPDITQKITNENIIDASLGLKYRLWSRWS